MKNHFQLQLLLKYQLIRILQELIFFFFCILQLILLLYAVHPMHYRHFQIKLFYYLFLVLFSMFNLQEQNYIQLILASQILLSSISVVIFYKINKFFFSKKISFLQFNIVFNFSCACLRMWANIFNIFANFFNNIIFLLFFSIYKKKNYFFGFIVFSNRRFANAFERRIYCNHFFLVLFI